MTTASATMTDDLNDRLVDTRLRIGTRTTPLAKAQTRRVVAQMEQVAPGLPVEIVDIETSADLWTGDLSQLGGKGNFTEEIDRALISGKIDIAVHSMKDVPGDVPLPKGTEFGAYLERGDVHDVVISRDGSQWVRSHGWGPTDDPASLGAWVAGDLLRQGARRLIAATSR